MIETTTVEDGSTASGLLAGIYASTVDPWRDFASLRCGYVVLRADSLFLVDGVRQAFATLRARDEP